MSRNESYENIEKRSSVHPSKVLSIAGSDSGGGAGIQADIKTISACGCYAMTAITAITVQNTIGVSAVAGVPAEVVAGQIRAVLDDIGADVIKIGMLNDAEIVRTVRRELDAYNFRNVVLDPVMVATSGNNLIARNAIQTLKEELLYTARVITPNIPEAETLLGCQIRSQEELPELAKRLSNNQTSVYLKGGHLTETDLLTDIFYNHETGEIIPLESPRIHTRNTHGTGCTLASALASFIAQGHSLNEAAWMAHDYVHCAIQEGAKYEIGHGHGPLHHFFHFWK